MLSLGHKFPILRVAYQFLNIHRYSFCADVRYIFVGRELRTSLSGVGNSSYELPEDLQGCDEDSITPEPY